MHTNSAQKNCTRHVPGELTVGALEAQIRNADYLETGSVGQTDFIIVR
jgi:hypothetical protein